MDDFGDVAVDFAVPQPLSAEQQPSLEDARIERELAQAPAYARVLRSSRPPADPIRTDYRTHGPVTGADILREHF
jgi:hypothetical protein